MSEQNIDKPNSLQEPIVLDAAIARVVVMEDRAQVTRRAALRLSKGRSLLRIAGVTALMADRSVRCLIKPQSAQETDNPSRVLDVKVRREYVMRSSRPEAEKDLRKRIEEMSDEYLETLDEMLADHQARKLVRKTEYGLRQQITDGVKLGPFLPQWEKELDEIFSKRAELEERLLSHQWEQDDRRLKLDRLGEELKAALAKIAQYSAELVIEVMSEAELPCLMEIDYQVPCAIWRPDYSAELSSKEDSPLLRWESAGMVWQATGEDWQGVELVFSTDRPALGASLPLLEDDLLMTREKTDREKQLVQVESRDEQIQNASDVSPSRYDTPPGIDDGGEVRNYRAPQKVDVPADGMPHRISFNSWKAEAKAELVCFPEKARFVYLRSEQKNPSDMPLLAGPVRLVRDGIYMGRGEVRYVGRAERFELSWGSEDGVYVRREMDRDYDETSIRKQRKYHYSITVNIINYSGAPKKLRLMERVPISEIEKVEVNLDHENTTKGFHRDEQGLLSWEVLLNDGQDKDIELDFSVVMPHNVVWSA